MQFVSEIANEIKESGIPLKNITIVVPSERMRKYLVAALFEAFGGPVVAPEMITMDRWIKSTCPHTVIDNTRALIELYAIHAEKEENPSFEDFLNWGQTLLSDINEIDRYMLESKQVFRNLAEIKEIENWSFAEENLSDNQRRFLEFWDRLPGYYEELNRRLLKKNSCYSGCAFRYVAEHPNLLFGNQEMHYIFAGFNALSKAEQSIMKQAHRLGRGHIRIDSDQWYLRDDVHEAGRFLRMLKEELGGENVAFERDELQSKNLDVQIIACAQQTGQAKVAATLLEKLPGEELRETLLLLADESLIVPTLKNLPASIGKANITLGLPIRNTALKTWVDLLFSIQQNKRKFKTKALYFHDVQTIQNHPFVQAAIEKEEAVALAAIAQNIISGNKIFVNTSTIEVGKVTSALVPLLTEDWSENWPKAVSKIRELNRTLYPFFGATQAFEKALLETFDKSLIDFENVLNGEIPEMKMKSFRLLFNQHWSRAAVAYHGNPMDGLQIMGLLETRGLDFKNIICLGMNEGNLPPTNPLQTLIPMDLRRFLGLPTPREKQGLFAHHFYRLLHACEQLWVTYTRTDETLGSNEPSRYLLQLEMELARINPNVQITQSIYALDAEVKNEHHPIVKTPEVLRRIDELLMASTSASMLKKYLSCPLDFYYRYVMDFGESDEVEEEIEHSTFGTFIHSTLEVLYRPFSRLDERGNPVIPEPPLLGSADIQRFLSDYKVVLKQQFLQHFNNDEQAFSRGKNLLSYRMAQELTERFLKAEKAFIEANGAIRIEALELEVQHNLNVTVNSVEKTVCLRGFIDRVDKIGDTLRIIDYKSGKVNAADVQFRRDDSTVEQLVDSFSKRKHVLQLLMYAYLFGKKTGNAAQSIIISFVSGKGEPFSLESKALSEQALLDAFPECIERILEGMYDTEIPFLHKDDRYNFCLYCE